MLKIFKCESLLKDWTVDNISFRLCFSTKKKDIKCTCKSGENTYTKVLIIQKVYYKIGGFTKKTRKQFIADIEYIIGWSTKMNDMFSLYTKSESWWINQKDQHIIIIH